MLVEEIKRMESGEVQSTVVNDRLHIQNTVAPIHKSTSFLKVFFGFINVHTQRHTNTHSFLVYF